MKKGILFDLDGTLVETWKTTPLPGVVETLERWRATGVQIGVATNQAGPLWRAMVGDEKFPTAQVVVGNIAAIARELRMKNDLWVISLWDARLATGSNEAELDDRASEVRRDILEGLQDSLPCVMVFTDPGYRKPNPGMLRYAMNVWQVPREGFCYVGDMASDQEAARNAGVAFQWASEFFQGQGNG